MGSREIYKGRASGLAKYIAEMKERGGKDSKMYREREARREEL